MKSGVTIWAGSLDESDDDFIYVRGRVLQPRQHDQEREQAITDISRASNASKDVVRVGSVRVRTTKSQLLVNIPVVERDIIGREAPAEGLIPRTVLSESGWVDAAVTEMAAVLGESGRTIDRSEVRAALLRAEALERRSPLRQLWAVLGRVLKVFRRLVHRARSRTSPGA